MLVKDLIDFSNLPNAIGDTISLGVELLEPVTNEETGEVSLVSRSQSIEVTDFMLTRARAALKLSGESPIDEVRLREIIINTNDLAWVQWAEAVSNSVSHKQGSTEIELKTPFAGLKTVTIREFTGEMQRLLLNYLNDNDFIISVAIASLSCGLSMDAIKMMSIGDFFEVSSHVNFLIENASST